MSETHDYVRDCECHDCLRVTVRNITAVRDRLPAEDSLTTDATAQAQVPSTAEETLRAATQYAHDLVVSLHRDHYADNNTFEPFDDLLGLLSQIDNMICGWKEPAQVPDADPFGDDAELCASLQSLDTDIGYRAASRIGQLAMLAAAQKKEGE